MKTLYVKKHKNHRYAVYRYFLGLLFLVTTFSYAADDLPDLGNSSSAVLSLKQEQELGLNIIKELRAAKAISHDVVVNDYLQALGYRLIATQNQNQTPFQFFAVLDKSINAFALPGGYIGVNTGLILASESESELAGVMAHEVGHVQQRHIARMYEHMGRVRLSTIAGAIASMILATQSAEAAQGALAATLAGGTQTMINFTREHEKEADYVGIVALSKAGFDPMGMPSFFQRMYQDTRFYGNYIPEYLLTHPLTESRLMVAQSRAKSFPYRQVADSQQYHLVHARLLADSFTSMHEANDYFAKRLEKGTYRNRMGILYAYVLVLLKQNKTEQAKPYLDELLTLSPNQPLFQLAYADCEMFSGQINKAINRLEEALLDHPNNQLLMAKYSELMIKNGQAAQVIPLLKSQVLRKPAYPQFWHLLSAAYTANRLHFQAHLAESQYLKAHEDYAGAATQLRIAQKLRNLTFQERNQLESELKEITKKLKS